MFEDCPVRFTNRNVLFQFGEGTGRGGHNQKRDNRDSGIFEVDFGGQSDGRGVSTGETDRRGRDDGRIVTRCGNLGFNEKSRGVNPSVSRNFCSEGRVAGTGFEPATSRL